MEKFKESQSLKPAEIRVRLDAREQKNSAIELQLQSAATFLKRRESCKQAVLSAEDFAGTLFLLTERANPWNSISPSSPCATRISG
jgi:hypothetical protein